MYDTLRGHTFLHSGISREAIVLDLGANHGLFSIEMRDKYGGKYFLVEANPNLAAELSALKTFPVLPYAVASMKGTVPFNISKNDTGSSMCTLLTDSVWGSVLDHEVSVPAETLETIVAEFKLAHIDLLKMDIEGAEIDVLTSLSREVLDHIGQITVEFHCAPDLGLTPEADVERVITFMKHAGFICMDFSEGSRRDVLLINRKHHDMHVLRRIMWWLRTSRPRWLTSLWRRLPAGIRRRLYKRIEDTSNS